MRSSTVSRSKGLRSLNLCYLVIAVGFTLLASKMARNSVEAMAFPSVDSTLALRPCVYSFVSKYTALTSATALSVIPPLKACLVARKELYEMKAKESKHCDQIGVVTWRGYGTFSWQGIQDIVQIHNAMMTRLEIKNEKKWFSELCSVLSEKQYEPLLEDVHNFMSTLWTSDAKGQVYNTTLTVETLSKIVCGRWFNDDIIECIFNMLNRDSKEHLFVVATESLLHSTKVQRNLSVEINKKVRDGLRYLHFALNVKKNPNGTVSVGNGNHWTYFVFDTSLSDLYYGDSLGFNLPNNLATVMKPYFETLCIAQGKPYTKPRRPTLMHHVNGRDFGHKCSDRCFQGFPLQTCGSACGLSPTIVAALARKDENLWKSILEWNKPDKVTMKYVNTIKHISANSSLLRAQIISWIVRDEVSLCYVVPKIATSRKGKNSPTGRILTQVDNPATRNLEMPTESLTVDTETPGESMAADIEMAKESLTADTETPGESMAADIKMPQRA